MGLREAGYRGILSFRDDHGTANDLDGEPVASWMREQQRRMASLEVGLPPEPFVVKGPRKARHDPARIGGEAPTGCCSRSTGPRPPTLIQTTG